MTTTLGFPALFGLAMLGGGIGAGARFGMSVAVQSAFARFAPQAGAFAAPGATLLCNVIGALAIGWGATRLWAGAAPGEGLRVLISVGVLGGFTTFSAFSLELADFVRRGDLGLAAFLGAGSVLACLMAALFGMGLGGLAK